MKISNEKLEKNINEMEIHQKLIKILGITPKKIIKQIVIHILNFFVSKKKNMSHIIDDTQ